MNIHAMAKPYMVPGFILFLLFLAKLNSSVHFV